MSAADDAPILARVFRGGKTESEHRGWIAVVDEDGALFASCGRVDRPIYLRSTAKPFQAMPLLEAGGEKEFRLGDDEIALMCASHGGEPRHVRVARRILERGGFHVRDLACGAHLPMHEPSAQALIRSGEKPTALHNNCSGKHGGLLLACKLLGFDPRGYFEPSHPLQKRILSHVAEFAGVPESRIGIAIDGCSLPVFFLPLAGLAASYARLVAPGRGDVPGCVPARIVKAMAASPGMVAGRDRFTTDFLEAGNGGWIGKEGAEGVYAIGLAPRRGRREKALGVAFKLEDGSSRARDAVALEILDALGRLPPAAGRRLARHRAPVIRSVRGQEVGGIRAEVSLARHGR